MYIKIIIFDTTINRKYCQLFEKFQFRQAREIYRDIPYFSKEFGNNGETFKNESIFCR